MNALMILTDSIYEFQEILNVLLEMAHFDNVHVYTDADSAYSEIARIDCNLMILDIDMAGIKPMKYAEEIVRDFPQMQLILASNSDEHAMDAMRIGVADYLMKPISSDTVIKKIMEMGGNRR